MLMGIFMSVGNLGAIIATTPLAWMAAGYGWRSAFLWIGAITLVLAVVTLTVTRDHPRAAEPAPRRTASGAHRGWAALRADLATVLLSGQFWIMGVILFGVYGTFVTLQGLWATPFLMAALGIDRVLASELNMAIPIGVIIGAPLVGWLGDLLQLDKRRAVIAGTVIYAGLWGAVQFPGAPGGRFGMALLLFLMGLAMGGFLTMAWGIVRERTPMAIMGLTSGLLNPLPMLGAAFFQVSTGAILDNAPKVGDGYALEGFTWALGLCFIGNLISIGLAFGIRKKDRLPVPPQSSDC
jgi:MFS family permease